LATTLGKCPKWTISTETTPPQRLPYDLRKVQISGEPEYFPGYMCKRCTSGLRGRNFPLGVPRGARGPERRPGRAARAGPVLPVGDSPVRLPGRAYVVRALAQLARRRGSYAPGSPETAGRSRRSTRGTVAVQKTSAQCVAIAIETTDVFTLAQPVQQTVGFCTELRCTSCVGNRTDTIRRRWYCWGWDALGANHPRGDHDRVVARSCGDHPWAHVNLVKPPAIRPEMTAAAAHVFPVSHHDGTERALTVVAVALL